jgi:hypothetical protein
MPCLIDFDKAQAVARDGVEPGKRFAVQLHNGKFNVLASEP